MRALLIALLLAGCASAPPRPAPLTIEDACSDDEECPAATQAEVIEFFRRYDP